MSINVFSQEPDSADTLNISEVFVKGNLNKYISSIFSKRTYDLTTTTRGTFGRIADVLNSDGGIFIKSYGPGAVATTSFRGAGASNTLTTWNGISLNSPMTGQADLSLLHSCLADRLSVSTGISSSSLASGGIGATIDISNLPDWERNQILSSGTSFGTEGSINSFIKGNYGRNNLTASTRIFHNYSLNSFRYFNQFGNPGPAYETRNNARYGGYGAMQDLYFKTSKSVTSGRIWLQSNERLVPGSLLTETFPITPVQKDFSVRSLFSHDVYLSESTVNTSIAWFSEGLSFSDVNSSVNSVNKTNTVFARAGIDFRKWKNATVSFTLENELNKVISGNYNGGAIRNKGSATSSLYFKPTDKTDIAIMYRQILAGNKLLLPDLSVGAGYRNGFATVKGSISRNSRLPSLNDLFWNPGGNPYLKNESSINAEFTVSAGKPDGVINASITAFASDTKDMIKWQPSEYGYWKPSNLSSVSSHGFETDLAIFAGVTDRFIKATAHYSFTRAINRSGESINRQVPYVPVNQAAFSIKSVLKKAFVTWNTIYTGQRFTTTDNSVVLDGYLINSIEAGISAGRKSEFGFTAGVNNIFNVSYEIMAYYPMPLRMFCFSAVYKLKK
jgi:iron complex outermembrane receptor protein